MVSITDILRGMKTQALTVCDTVYTQERPTAVSGELRRFIVVGIPTSMREEVMCSVYDWWTHCIVQFEIYVKDMMTNANPNQLNVVGADDLFRDVLSLFPFVIEGDEHRYHVTRPDVVYVGKTDDNGFHKTLIQAELSTI